MLIFTHFIHFNIKTNINIHLNRKNGVKRKMLHLNILTDSVRDLGNENKCDNGIQKKFKIFDF